MAVKCELYSDPAPLKSEFSLVVIGLLWDSLVLIVFCHYEPHRRPCEERMCRLNINPALADSAGSVQVLWFTPMARDRL